MPNTKSTRSAHRSKCPVNEKSVSPRRHTRSACGATRSIALSIQAAAPAWLGALPGRLTRYSTSLVLASETISGAYPQIPLYEMSMPALCAPVVGAMVPSASR